MKVDIQFAHLHSGIFIAGTGLSEKLDVSMRQKGAMIEGLTYDREYKELLIKYKGVVAIVPSSNIACMTPKEEVKAAPATAPQAEKQKPGPKPGKVSAQVSGPSLHVFVDGPGKTRD